MDVSEYLEGWRRRAREEAQLHARAIERARAAVPAAVAALKRRGATRIWLIGSLARGTFRQGSDLDFLVEGLSEEAAWQAASEAADATGMWVDVVRSDVSVAERPAARAETRVEASRPRM